MSAARQPGWLLRKACRLFFDDWRLSVPMVAWLALSLVLQRLGVAPAWRGITLFVGLAAILVGAAVMVSRPRRVAGRQEPVRRSASTAGPVDPALRPGS